MSELDKISESIDDLENEVRDVASEVKDVATKVELQEDRLSDLEAHLYLGEFFPEDGGRLDGLESIIEDNGSQIVDLASAVESLEERLDALQSTTETLPDQLDELESTTDVMVARLEDVESNLYDLKEDVRESSDDLKQLKEDLVALRIQLERSKGLSGTVGYAAFVLGLATAAIGGWFFIKESNFADRYDNELAASLQWVGVGLLAAGLALAVVGYRTKDNDDS